MIVIVSALLGAVWGGYLAKRRGGNRLDVAQYAAVLAILFAIIGLVITIIIHRTLV